MKPFIGVVPLVDQERESYWMLPGYMQGILSAGGVPVMLPLTGAPEVIDQLTAAFDGFLFTGGQDVSPSLYKQAPLPQCGLCCPQRDSMETALFHAALDADKPVLGICRGIQLINAVLGGTLYQDLPTQHLSHTVHSMTPPYDRAVHGVTVLPQTPLADLLACRTLWVNSYHHQAVKDLSPRLKPMALSEDGLVEAAYMPDRRFVMAVQWHPEFLYRRDQSAAALLQAFVQAAARG